MMWMRKFPGFRRIVDVILVSAPLFTAILLLSSTFRYKDSRNPGVLAYNRALAMGAIRFNSSDFSGALDYFNDAVLINPRKTAPYYNRGVVLMRMKSYGRAATEFTAALLALKNATSIVAVDCYFNRGVSFSEQEEFEKAVNDFKVVSEIYPSHPHAEEYLEAVEMLARNSISEKDKGKKLFEKGNYAEAVEKFSSILSRNSDDEEARHLLAVSHWKAGNMAEALRGLLYLAEMYPENGKYSYYVGLAYHVSNFFSKAATWYTKSLSAQPDNVDTLYNRGMCYFELGNFDTALNDLIAAVQLKPEESSLYNARGLCYWKRRMHSAAIKDYGTAILLNPRNIEAYSNRADALRELNKNEEAEADLRMVRTLSEVSKKVN